MALIADDRAQSIQVGAVLLFAVLILAFSMYQAFIVPEQNKRVEFEHNQEVRGQLNELRNAIVSTQSGASRSTTIDLGTQYPPRAIALNPDPPTGTLRTVGTDDPAVNLTIRNATASGEARDVWDGDARHFNTGGLTYRPTYTRYDGAPLSGYEHTVLYDEFDADALVAANQTFLQGESLSLITLNGSLQRSSGGSTAVDVRPISSAERTVQIDAQDASSPVTLNFTSRLSADRWRTVLSDQDNVQSVTGYDSPAGEGFTAVQVKLATGVTYELEMTKAAVGTGATDEGAAYLTDVSGDGGSVARGNSQELTLEVRDAYNNPVGGVTVDGDVGSGGSLASTQETTGDDGRVTFVYRTTASTPTETHTVNFTTNGSAVLSTRPFDTGRPKNATTAVTVTSGAGGGGAYSLNWMNPDDESANSDDALSNCDGEACTWDVGANGDDSLRLNATIDPPYFGITLEYAVDNSTVATVAPDTGTTDDDGTNRPTLTARENGTVSVLGSGNEGSDEIEIELTNLTGLEPSAAEQVQYVSGSAEDTNNDGAVDFELENTGTETVTIQNVTVTSTEASNAERVAETQGGSTLDQREFGFDGSDDGYHEAGDQWDTEGVPIGTTAGLDDTASLDGGTTMTVFMRSFVERYTWEPVDQSGSEIVVEIGYADGSVGTYALTPT